MVRGLNRSGWVRGFELGFNWKQERLLEGSAQVSSEYLLPKFVFSLKNG